MRTRGRWRVRRDTQRHTHIYICAHMYIYACLGGRGGVSLSGGGVWGAGGGRGQGTACCAPGRRRRITRTLGCREKKNKKKSFQASTWPYREPCRGQSNQRLPAQQSAVQCAAGRWWPPHPSPGRWDPNGDGGPRSPTSPAPCSALRGGRWQPPARFGVPLGDPTGSGAADAGFSRVRGCMRGCYGATAPPGGHRHPLALPPAPGALQGTARGWTVALRGL